MPSKSKKSSLIIGEIYKSIHGELPNQGKVVSIVRLSGCLSQCAYCDAKQFWSLKGKSMTLDAIVSRLMKIKVKSVLLTGGEPLHQDNSIKLLQKLIKKGFELTLETDGTYDLRNIPKTVTIVMDLKTPQSKSKRKSLLSNLKYLKRADILKVVVSGKEDYSWAKNIMRRYAKSIKCEVVFSPVYDKLSAQRLYEMMLKDNSKHRMQIQLHKYLGLK